MLKKNAPKVVLEHFFIWLFYIMANDKLQWISRIVIKL